MNKSTFETMQNVQRVMYVAMKPLDMGERDECYRIVMAQLNRERVPFDLRLVTKATREGV
jgi:hypothetical protein